MSRPGFSSIPGVEFSRLTAHADLRGSFREIWRASQIGSFDEESAGRPAATFVQANVSTSAQGVLRGLHCHRRQLDYWVVLGGRAFAALVDLRPILADPAASPVVETREISADDGLVIPRGVAHGFLALEPLQLLYLVTSEYDGSDELGFAWDDPAVSVRWPRVPGTPGGHPILSPRDQSNPPLAELIARLGSLR